MDIAEINYHSGQHFICAGSFIRSGRLIITIDNETRNCTGQILSDYIITTIDEITPTTILFDVGEMFYDAFLIIILD